MTNEAEITRTEIARQIEDNRRRILNTLFSGNAWLSGLVGSGRGRFHKRIHSSRLARLRAEQDRLLSKLVPVSATSQEKDA